MGVCVGGGRRELCVGAPARESESVPWLLAQSVQSASGIVDARLKDVMWWRAETFDALNGVGGHAALAAVEAVLTMGSQTQVRSRQRVASLTPFCWFACVRLLVLPPARPPALVAPGVHSFEGAA